MNILLGVVIGTNKPETEVSCVFDPYFMALER